METRFQQSPCLSVYVLSSHNFKGVSQFQQSVRDENLYTKFIKMHNQAEETLGIEPLRINN